jgi:MFS family permease
MTIGLPGLSIHEPDVALTDLALAILSGYFGWRLRASPEDRGEGQQTLRIAGVLIMLGLASAALFGAIFHAFFPDNTATPSGRIAWAPVVLSILTVAATLLWLALSVLAPWLARRIARGLLLVYCLSFAVVALLLDDSFGGIVRFYGPVLILILIAAAVQAVRTRSVGWMLLAGGFAISILAALLQQAGVSIHPRYFNHNAVYHVVQGIALVLLYYGFRTCSRSPASSC